MFTASTERSNILGISRCTIGTDTLLVIEKTRSIFYRMSGMKKEITYHREGPDCLVTRGDRWNSFATDGPIFFCEPQRYPHSILHLEAEKLSISRHVSGIIGRMACSDEVIAIYDAGRGKLMEESKLEGDFSEWSSLILLEDKIGLIMSESETNIADMRCTKIISTMSGGNCATVSGCRLFYSTRKHHSTKDLEFEKTHEHWMIKTKRWSFVDKLYSWHQASHLMVAIVWDALASGYQIYLINSRILSYVKIGNIKRFFGYYFPAFADGIPVLCKMDDNGQVDVVF